MPESRHRYLYERLGDHDFQQLVSALLADQFPDYIPMALRQADGGRDGLRKVDASRVLIYQVKWSVSGTQKDPVRWLDQIVRSEEANLRRLADQGVRHYILVTNVGSTAKPESGTFDQVDKRLDAHAREFGYEQMTCIWREALNPWVDNAPTETKWAYADMLAGWDLVRYLVAEHVGVGKDKAHRDLIDRHRVHQAARATMGHFAYCCGSGRGVRQGDLRVRRELFQASSYRRDERATRHR